MEEGPLCVHESEDNHLGSQSLGAFHFCSRQALWGLTEVRLNGQFQESAPFSLTFHFHCNCKYFPSLLNGF